MILTNPHNIPAKIIADIKKYINSDPYNMPDDIEGFRTTELLGPPLLRTLYQRYKDSDELVIDATLYLATMFGTVFHKMCEGESTLETLYEIQIDKTFEYAGKKVTVFGTIDGCVRN